MVRFITVNPALPSIEGLIRKYITIYIEAFPNNNFSVVHKCKKT